MPESPAAAPAASERSPRVALAALVAGLGLLLGAALAARLASNAIEALTTDDDPWADGRLRAMLELLPELARTPGDTVLMIGPSDVEMDFAPDLFEAEVAKRGKRVTAYNLGLAGLSPPRMWLFARRLREVFGEAHAQPALTIVSFAPMTMTTRYTTSERRWGEQELVRWIGPRALLAIASRDPARALRLFFHKYLLGGVLPETRTRFLQNRGEPDLCGMRLDGDWTDAQRRAVAVWCEGLRRAVPDHKIPAWSRTLKGRHQLAYPENRVEYEGFIRAATAPEHLAADVKRRERCCDGAELRFDPASLDEFVAAIDELKKLSRRVAVILFPANVEWLKRTPEAAARLRDAVALVEERTGVPVLDWSRLPGITGADFMDTTHLNEMTGVPKLTGRIAAQFADSL